MSEEKKNETQQQPEKQAVPQAPDIKKVFGDFAGSPDQEQVDAWKAEHGDIFVTAFSEEEIFVFRALNRELWTQLSRLAAENPEVDQEAETVNAVLLWSSIPPEKMLQKAGTITSLASTIMEHSNFVPPQFASVLTVRL